MAQMNVVAGDGAWEELKAKAEAGQLIHLADAATIGIAHLAGGMSSGRASLTIRLDLPDGRTVLAETSLRLFLQVADILAKLYPEEARQTFSADAWAMNVDPASRSATIHFGEQPRTD